MQEITVPMDKGFPAKRTVRALQELGVRYVMKVPAGSHVVEALSSWWQSSRAEGIFEDAETVYMNSGRLWSDRLLAFKGVRTANIAE